MTRAIRLERRLTHDAAGRLWDEILALKGAPVELDASDVRHLSASALQVLLVAERLGHRDGHPLKITSPSDTFADGLRLLGAEGQLAGGLA